MYSYIVHAGRVTDGTSAPYRELVEKDIQKDG
jgi:hypothetical protein